MQPGSRIAHFEVLGLIGAGGMGEVYKARDTRLGRDVAIKVLPAEFADNPDRLRRFEHEARAVAALSHPNVLAVYDVGTHEDSPYLVTELLEGETLRERLDGESLTVRKAVEVGIQIARGLTAAHEKGIVHRDLKPSNVFLTKDDQVKLLDFGLAKLTRPEPAPGAPTEGSVSSTETGAVMGTVGYMSPEQVRGMSADHRTDIFSFGCVLHEMLSGARPFRGDTTGDVMAAILKEDPAALPPRVPPALAGIVGRCLEKRPEDRFASAHDLALALQAESGALVTTPAVHRTTRQWRSVALALVGIMVLAVAGVLVLKLKPAGPRAGTAGQPKIVVLPFENLGSQEDAYFAAGMTEEITSRLANVQGLGVISRTSALEYTRRGKTVKESGIELGVDYVLEGSVRWEHSQGYESRVRITPQLIRVADDTHVWADRYGRVIADVFAMQSEVAENAVKAMGVKLLPREQSALKEISTNDLEAYDLYLRGQAFYNGGDDRRHVEGALKMFQAAVDRDPRFTEALAGLAKMHLFMYWFFFDRSLDRIVKAEEAARQAVEFRPDLAETHAALGYHYYQGLLDYPRAPSEFSAALRIQPKSTDALFGRGAVLRRQGLWAGAADTMSKALELDPKNAALLQNFSESCVLARRYADADRAYGLAITLSPHLAELHARKAWLRVQYQGDVERAQEDLDEVRRVGELTDGTGLLAYRKLAVSLARRDYQRALRELESETRYAISNQFQYLPIPLLRGEVQMLDGQWNLAHRSFEATRLELEQGVTQDPDDFRFHSSLGIVYAGLGRPVEAVREAKAGCDLMPASKDALRALYCLEDLALVYTMVGQASEAIAQLDDLLARSGQYTPHDLRLDPRWDPLRSDPRFQALLTKYEVKP